MSDNFISMKTIRFLIHEVFRAETLTKYPYFQDHDRELFDMVLETAHNLGRNLLRPNLKVMDVEPPELVDGRVKVHPMVREFMKECGEGGWICATSDYEAGGQQIPEIIRTACSFIFAAANYSASVYPMLTTGAAHLIESFGRPEMKEIYLPRLQSGIWQGTMAMTEPQAGSSLADVITRAEPTDQGYYLISGQKIFISAGDHDGVDNVVHMLLARINGAPAGVKGISLFLVPRLRPALDGTWEANDVQVAGVFHKLGYRGCPITQLSLGENNDCRGFLVGEPHKGLSYMFQMMNSSRIEVGVGAAGIALAAYYASLDYARERPQGRKAGVKDPAAPPVSIIEHADVKRMLLFQRAVAEGALSLLLQCSYYADRHKTADRAEGRKYQRLLEILTPVAKSYPSEFGILSCSQGLQILGGYGYCDEFPLEQYYRDCRIHPIHEGTTGIQAIDLLGRKVLMENRQAYLDFLAEVRETVTLAGRDPALVSYADLLGSLMDELDRVTTHLSGLSEVKGVAWYLADATLYLEMFSLAAVAWQWLKMGQAASAGLSGEVSEVASRFYRGRLLTMKYFFHYETPKIWSLSRRLHETDGLTLAAGPELFED